MWGLLRSQVKQATSQVRQIGGSVYPRTAVQENDEEQGAKRVVKILYDQKYLPHEVSLEYKYEGFLFLHDMNMELQF